MKFGLIIFSEFWENVNLLFPISVPVMYTQNPCQVVKTTDWTLIMCEMFLHENIHILEMPAFYFFKESSFFSLVFLSVLNVNYSRI